MPSRNSAAGKPRNDGKRPYMSDGAYVIYMKWLRATPEEREEFHQQLRRQGFIISRATASS